MSFIIRKALPADAPVITQVGRQSFYDAFVDLFQSTQELDNYLDHTYNPVRIENSIRKPNNLYFLAFANELPVGFAKMRIHSNRPFIASQRQSELQKFYVLQQYHGTGAAQALINAVIKNAEKEKAEQLWLDVHVGNEKAKRFYEKNGFTKAGDHNFIIGTQIFYYDVMALPLTITISKNKEYGSSQ